MQLNIKCRKTVFNLIVLIPFAFYTIATFWNISRPGPYYDEIIDLTDSIKLAKKEGTYPIKWIHWTINVGNKRIPVMRYVYTGPIKTYYIAALFTFLPVRVSTARYALSLLGLCSLIMTYFFVKRLFNRGTAFLTVLLLSTDLSYVFLNRMDNGPIAVMMICKAGALLFLLKWWQEGKLWPLLLGMFFLGLGLADKLNFVHFIVSLGVVSLLVLRKKLLKNFRRFGLLFALLCFLIGAAPFLYYHINHSDALLQLWQHSTQERTMIWGKLSFDPLANIQKVFRLAQRTFDGTFEQGWILSKAVTKLWVPELLIISFIIYLIFIFSRKGSQLLRSRAMAFVILNSILIFTMMVFTPHARLAWHFMMIYPFPYIFCSMVFVTLISMPSRGRRILNKILPVCAIIMIGIVIFINLKAIYIVHGEIEKDRVAIHWSDRIYDLADYLKQNPQKTANCMDWGFYTNLAFLLRGEVNLIERLGLMYGEKSRSYETLHTLFQNQDHIYIFHPPHFTGSKFKEMREMFEEALRGYGYEAIRVKSFFDVEEREIYSLFKVKPAS